MDIRELAKKAWAPVCLLALAIAVSWALTDRAEMKTQLQQDSERNAQPVVFATAHSTAKPCFAGLVAKEESASFEALAPK